MALARSTKLTIFDEPEAGIDLWSFQNLIRVFEKMHEETKGCIIIISHQERILSNADSIAVMKDGRLVQFGARDDVLPGLLGTTKEACDVLLGKMGGAV